MRSKPPVALCIFSNDLENYLEHVEQERKEIQKALEQYHDTNRLKVILHSAVSILELSELFQRYHQQIVLFHFSGHANGKGLQLNKNTTKKDMGYTQGIVGLIQKEVQEGQLKFVFLNGCSTTPQVKALQAAGVPSIIATHFPISDRKAASLAGFLYRTLANTSKDKPFEESPVSIEQAFDRALAYLEKVYPNPKISYRNTATSRWCSFFETAEKEEDKAWELFTTTPNWHLPNTPIHEINLSPLRLFLMVFIPLLAMGIAYGLYHHQVMLTPVDLKVTLANKTPNADLPALDATIVLEYKGERKSAHHVKAETTFYNLIRSYNDNIKLSFKANGFTDRDTTFELSKGITFPIWRDDTYAKFDLF